jgi:hypothetical protein
MSSLSRLEYLGGCWIVGKFVRPLLRLSGGKGGGVEDEIFNPPRNIHVEHSTLLSLL